MDRATARTLPRRQLPASEFAAAGRLDWSAQVSAFDHWMRFHVGDYLADTMHLTTFQHGIYVLLIMHYFKRGGLPDDDASLARIAKAPPHLWRYAEPVMALFQRQDGRWTHSRIDAERAHAQQVSETKAEAGRSGAKARWHTTHRTESYRGGYANTVNARKKRRKASDINDPDMASAKAGDGMCFSARRGARASPEPDPKNPPRKPPQSGGSAATDLPSPRKAETNPRAKGTNPRAGNQQHKPSRNGFVDAAIDMMREDEDAEADDACAGSARVVHLARHPHRR